MKKKQRFHSKWFAGRKRIEMRSHGLLIPIEKAIELVTINGEKFVKKTPSATWKKHKHDAFRADDPGLARQMTLGESSALRGIWRIYSRLLRKGAFQRIYARDRSGIRITDYFLRPVKIYRVNTSIASAAENFIIEEFLDKPNALELIRYLRQGASKRGKFADARCQRFIEKQKLYPPLKSDSLKQLFNQQLARALESIATQAIEDLETASSEFKNNARKRFLNSNFMFDFTGPAFSTPAFHNLIVESVDKNGKFHFVFKDPLALMQQKEAYPSVRTNRRNRGREVQLKTKKKQKRWPNKRRKKKN